MWKLLAIPGGQLPMTLVAIDVAGCAVGLVGLGPVDDELSATERGGQRPWILGMVVRAESRKLGVGRQLLESLHDVAASLGHPWTWVATGDEAVGFYQRCGWTAVEHLRLESTGIPTAILMRATKTIAAESDPVQRPLLRPSCQDEAPGTARLRPACIRPRLSDGRTWVARHPRSVAVDDRSAPR
jgi:GNAT superfamily N-acetyltransferase